MVGELKKIELQKFELITEAKHWAWDTIAIFSWSTFLAVRIHGKDFKIFGKNSENLDILSRGAGKTKSFVKISGQQWPYTQHSSIY